MLDFCSTGKPHYKVPHYNVVFNIHVTCQYNKLSLIVCDYGPQRQKYTTWLTCTFYGALLKIGSQNQKLCSLHEKCRSVGQNQRNFILTDKIFYSVRQQSNKNYHNYNDNIEICQNWVLSSNKMQSARQLSCS